MLPFCLFWCILSTGLLYRGGNHMQQITEAWSSLEEVAAFLGVNKETVRNWIKKTDIPAHKIGRQWKFKLSEVDAWVKSGKSAL